jgi:SAM-dependent methyltransferase
VTRRGVLQRAAVAVGVAALLAGAPRAAGLDVPTPYIPSTALNVDEMLRLAAVHPTDIVYDLGSGDGRVVIAAARDWGARGVGIELEPVLVAESRKQAALAGVADRVRFIHGDVLKADVREASVVTMYLLAPLVAKLKPKLMGELKPGTRIVAHEYGFVDWQPDRHVRVSKNFYLYVVPSDVAGRWRLSVGLPEGARAYELELEQHYQEVSGGARVAGGFLPAFEARLEGTHIAFVLVDGELSYRYAGHVAGDAMEGSVRWGFGPSQREAPWRATRTAARHSR